jgi:hypothetical protein
MKTSINEHIYEKVVDKFNEVHKIIINCHETELMILEAGIIERLKERFADNFTSFNKLPLSYQIIPDFLRCITVSFFGTTQEEAYQVAVCGDELVEVNMSYSDDFHRYTCQDIKFWRLKYKNVDNDFDYSLWKLNEDVRKGIVDNKETYKWRFTVIFTPWVADDPAKRVMPEWLVWMMDTLRTIYKEWQLENPSYPEL